MRPLTLAFVLMLACVGGGSAEAARDVKLEVVHNLSGPEAGRVRSALDTALYLFMLQVRRNHPRPGTVPAVSFEFRPDTTLREEMLPARLRGREIALVLGTVSEAEPGTYTAEGTVYIGPSPGDAVLSPGHNTFRRAWANVNPQFSNENELENYELIIGYALLRWAWLIEDTNLRDADLIAAIARTLVNRAKAIRTGGTSVAASRCLVWVRDTAANFLPRPPARPARGARDRGSSEFRCRTR